MRALLSLFSKRFILVQDPNARSLVVVFIRDNDTNITLKPDANKPDALGTKDKEIYQLENSESEIITRLDRERRRYFFVFQTERQILNENNNTYIYICVCM